MTTPPIVVPLLGWGAPEHQLMRDAGVAPGQRNLFPLDNQDIAGLPRPGAGLVHPSTNPRDYLYAYNDFPKDAPAVGGSDDWAEGAVGSGSGTATMTAEPGGAIQLSGGTSLAGYTYVQYGQNNAPLWSPARHPHFEGRLVLTASLPIALEAHAMHIGFVDDFTVANPNNIIAFRTLTSGNWFAVTRTGGGAAVTTDLGLAPLLNTWYLWYIDVDTKGGRVRFTIYTSAFLPVFVAQAVHTTGIPTAALNGGCRSYNVAAQTATRDISVDYMQMHQHRWAVP